MVYCVFDEKFLFLQIKSQYIVPPQITPFSFGEDSFNAGDSVGVQCMIAKGDLPIFIKWTLNSRPIISEEDGIIITKLSPKSSVLNIPSVDEEHRGIFKCIAENDAGVAEYASELNVNGWNIFLVLS